MLSLKTMTAVQADGLHVMKKKEVILRVGDLRNDAPAAYATRMVLRIL